MPPLMKNQNIVWKRIEIPGDYLNLQHEFLRIWKTGCWK